MIPTLILISIVSFVIIQLPPGDFLDSYVASLSDQGESVDAAILEGLKTQYGLDKPVYIQYLVWMSGVVRGDFGVSLEWRKPVADLIYGRLFLTVIVSSVTLLFSWMVSFVIGIHSATHQYSLSDYFATFVAFLGLAIPHFMLALLLMWGAYKFLGLSVGGLFSPRFIEAPWSLARVGDLLGHVWIPVVIIGVGGTAGLIRTLRANLLDELGKPYVVTCRAKGIPENKLLFRHPVRVALIPFTSTVGWSLSGIVSGETITAVVLSLPTTGPLLLKALQSQDMYLAGTFIMFLSVLTVIGTLLSDIMLAWLDPRIRYD